MSSILTGGLLGAHGGRKREQGWRRLYQGERNPSDKRGHKIPECKSATPPTTHHHRPQHSIPSANTHRLPKPALLKEPSSIHPRLPPPHSPQTWTSREQPQPKESPPLLSQTRTRLTWTETGTAFEKHPRPHPQTLRSTHRR